MEDWEFVITEAAGSLGIPQMRAVASNVDIADAKVQQERIEADDYFKLYPWTPTGATYTDLEKWLRTKGVTSNRKISDLFNVAMESGIIYKTDKKKYHYNGLNKQTPNDQPQQMPFDAPDNGNLPY
jgi:hypothetical protein